MPDLAVAHASKKWSSLGEYLERDDARLLVQEDRLRLRADYEDILRQETQLEDAILIGLVGGTGVGKSTFINALAGEAVSRSGDRRPTTDRIVLYRHVDSELPDDVPTDDFAQPSVLHTNKDLTKVILLDFPDFDSAEHGHTRILQNHLEFLDVLLVVVDDVKYADRRLYQLLSTIDHDPKNLFVLLNKIDRLEMRYQEDTPRVVKELVADLREKMRVNAGLDLQSDQFFPLSAGSIFTARTQGIASPLEASFRAVENLLAGYQTEKYRRQVRERNIDSRQLHLVESVRGLVLSDENRSIVKESQVMLEAWQTDMKTSLAAIRPELLGEGERRGLRRSHMRRAGPQMGLPFSLVFAALIEMPWARKATDVLQPAELGGRIHQHYRGYFESIKNLISRYQSEFAGSTIASANSGKLICASRVLTTSPEQWSTEMATKVQAKIQDEESIGKPRRWLHLPAACTLLLAIWSKIYPLVQATTGSGERGFFESLAGGLLGALNPMFLIGVAFALVVAYLLTGLYLWVRETQKLDATIHEAESAIRMDVSVKGQEVLDSLQGNLTELTAEMQRVEEIIGS